LPRRDCNDVIFFILPSLVDVNCHHEVGQLSLIGDKNAGN
jgi:hypothetical protein